jgi:hypothetical protein
LYLKPHLLRQAGGGDPAIDFLGFTRAVSEGFYNTGCGGGEPALKEEVPWSGGDVSGIQGHGPATSGEGALRKA